jgi:N-methylhydantoinase B
MTPPTLDSAIVTDGPACDPVTLEIIRGAIMATQREMEALIERTAISAFIREKKDFYTALFDENGVMAVGSMVPVFGDMTTPVFEKFPRHQMKPGDLFWYNDCYGSNGAVTHSNDQVLLKPVFHNGRLCAFVMGWAHFADIGGLRPGSISPETTSIFQEGIIIPPTRLIDGGVVNEMALAIFHRNSRYPAQSEGDMSALMAAVSLGAARVADVVARHGADTVSDALAQLLDRTRLLVRSKLAENFDYGTYRFSDQIDSDGHGNGPFSLRFAITREKGADGNDRFIFDATESDDQAPGPVNLIMNPGVPGMALGLFYLGGDASQVCNAGGPLALDEVRLREGSIVKPKFPAPLGMRGLTLMRMLAVLNGLVNRGKGGAPAAQSAYVVTIMRGTFGADTGTSSDFLLADGIGVGYGARDFADGIDAVYFVAQENYPVEFLESSYPIRLRKYGVVPDSGGPGRWRGGTGIIREYEILADEAVLAIRIDGVKNPPWGYAGGMSAGVGGVWVNPETPQERVIAPLSDGTKLVKGDILRIQTGGGGGMGHPYDRPSEMVLDDVHSGFVTAEAAQKFYGVCMSGDTLDAAATDALRRNRPPVKAFHRNIYMDELI